MKPPIFNFINAFAVVIFGCIFYWFYTGQDDPSNVAETFKNILLLIVGFFFGSSKSSAIKNETLNEAVKNSKDNSTNVQADTVTTDTVDTVNATNLTVTNESSEKADRQVP